MLTILYAWCVGVAWDPATNATHYDLYVDGTYYQTVVEPLVGLCLSDFGDEYRVQHDIYVVGLNDDEEQGVPSQQLVIEWWRDFDIDADGVVGWTDFGQFAAAFGHTGTLACDRFDTNDNGVVDFADFGQFAASFGHCNNGQREIPCET